jgi:hypothetical protein
VSLGYEELINSVTVTTDKSYRIANFKRLFEDYSNSKGQSVPERMIVTQLVKILTAFYGN